MSTQVQYRRGTTAQNDAFVGALGEITVDTTNWTLRVADGITVGGYTMVGTTATQTLTNKIYNGTSVSVTGNITGGNVSTAGLITATGNITGGNINTAGLITATGNITGGNINTAGQVSATGNVTGNYLLGNASFVTGLSAFKILNGTSYANIATSNGNIAFAVNNVPIVSITSAGIENNQANGVGNIGNATIYFNTVFAKATSAQYADVAEKYLADDSYDVGTVLEVGGVNEVTSSKTYHATGVVGVVSHKPAYIMNDGLAGDFVVAVALLGRVPVKVVGTVKRGDLLVSSHQPGVATALNDAFYRPGCVIGKSLQDYDSAEPGFVEAIVGRI